MRSAVFAAGLLSCGFCFFSEPLGAAAKKKSPEKPDVAAAAVEKVLRAEVAGAVDRRQQLAETLKHRPDATTARWQAGFIKAGDSWRSFDGTSQDLASAGLLGEYRRRREEAPQTFRGQIDLANWCRK
jgi:hypothetical protein